MQQNNTIAKAESQTIEYKQLWKDNYLKTICAFANSAGGLLYIGITDGGEVIGVENAKTLLETLPNKINNRLGILVDVVVKQDREVEYLEIKTNKTNAPVSVNGKFYKRSGSNTIELNGSNLTNFLLNKYGKTWDDIIVEAFSINEISIESVEKFKKLAKDRIPDIDKEDKLEELLKS